MKTDREEMEGVNDERSRAFSPEHRDINSSSEGMNLFPHWPCPCASPSLVSSKQPKHTSAGPLQAADTVRNTRDIFTASPALVGARCAAQKPF